MMPACQRGASREGPACASTMRERDALVDAGIIPASPHNTPNRLSRRRVRLALPRRPWSSSSSWLNTSISRLLTSAINSASTTRSDPCCCASAIQGTPVQSGHSGPANWLGCTAGANTSPRPPPHTPATATASATRTTADSSPGMRGQRQRNAQASPTTASAASRCQPVRAFHRASPPRQSRCAPGPPPSTAPPRPQTMRHRNGQKPRHRGQPQHPSSH